MLVEYIIWISELTRRAGMLVCEEDDEDGSQWVCVCENGNVVNAAWLEKEREWKWKSLAAADFYIREKFLLLFLFHNSSIWVKGVWIPVKTSQIKPGCDIQHVSAWAIYFLLVLLRGKFVFILPTIHFRETCTAIHPSHTHINPPFCLW